MSKIRIGLPKNSSVYESAKQELCERGIETDFTPSDRCYRDENGEFEVYLLRSQDIPRLVDEGELDYGISGIDLIAEYGLSDTAAAIIPTIEAERLGFGEVELWLAAENEESLEGENDIATSYPELTLRYIRGNDKSAISNLSGYEVHEWGGSVEIATELGADAIVEVVDSGRTLEANGLKPLEKVMDSETVLFSKGLQSYDLIDPEKSVTMFNDRAWKPQNPPENAWWK